MLGEQWQPAYYGSVGGRSAKRNQQADPATHAELALEADGVLMNGDRGQAALGGDFLCAGTEALPASPDATGKHERTMKIAAALQENQYALLAERV